MKPLELTIYPKSRGMFGAQYDLPGGRHMLAREGADVMSRNKRLTDAELAAEYHQADVNFQRHIWQELSRGEDWTDEVWERIAHPVNTLHRFATLPHYDEASL